MPRKPTTTRGRHLRFCQLCERSQTAKPTDFDKNAVALVCDWTGRNRTVAEPNSARRFLWRSTPHRSFSCWIEVLVYLIETGVNALEGLASPRP